MDKKDKKLKMSPLSIRKALLSRKNLNMSPLSMKEALKSFMQVNPENVNKKIKDLKSDEDWFIAMLCQVYNSHPILPITTLNVILKDIAMLSLVILKVEN